MMKKLTVRRSRYPTLKKSSSLPSFFGESDRPMESDNSNLSRSRSQIFLDTIQEHVLKTYAVNRATCHPEATKSALTQCCQSVREMMNELDPTASEDDAKERKILLSYLLKLESLLRNYSSEARVYEAARTMATAYNAMQSWTEKIASYQANPDNKIKGAITSLKDVQKKTRHNLYDLESQICLYLGSFSMQMKGIQGYSRVCPGDMYEITVRLAEQKWKVRGRIGQSPEDQEWDYPLATFIPKVGHQFEIKAREIKNLGKKRLLKNQTARMDSLFTHHPQLLSINLNSIGSIKLQINVCWSPWSPEY